MATNLSNFNPTDIRNFGGFFNSTGIHTANKYEISVVAREPVTSAWSNLGITPNVIDDTFNYTLVNLTIPNGAISTTPVRSYGEAIEMPYGKTYDTANLTHYLDNNGVIHSLYTTWMNCVFDPNTRTLGYYNDYVATIYIKLYRRIRIGDKVGHFTYKNEPFVLVTLHDAYPKAINPFSMQGLSGNAPTQFDVNITCRRITTDYNPQTIKNANENGKKS